MIPFSPTHAGNLMREAQQYGRVLSQEERLNLGQHLPPLTATAPKSWCSDLVSGFRDLFGAKSPLQHPPHDPESGT